MMPSYVFYTLLMLSRVSEMDSALTNIALAKPAVQTDTANAWGADRAVDNVMQDNIGCSGTETITNSWLVIDLLHKYNLGEFKIFNRREINGYLANFYIYVSDSNPVPDLVNNNTVGDLCLHHPTPVKNRGFWSLARDMSKPLFGQYVYFWKPQNGQLFICEFQIWVHLGNAVFSKHQYPKHRTSIPPLYTEYQKPVSPATCAVVCMYTEKESTHFQLNFNIGACHCIQFTKLFEEDLGLVQDDNWYLWDMRKDEQKE